ncbi:GNAT family N-acetyltransferase [Vreelandella zhanjiangensis]|uniref:GNAT family N-acetyltransferase n=1 Tax=Vreelandella zhanjiangensis TaxID=1121960 RepID=UPI001ABF8906|nr:GNAT family N-acetyltransferase [Halomonas zhanjiangensis]
MKIRQMEATDLDEAAKVHSLAFPRQAHSYEWLKCNFSASPRFLCFVAEVSGNVIGYIMWMQKSGFRSEAVLELEQLAVLPNRQGQGVGKQLIESSLPLVKEQLVTHGSTLKHILVTTRADNAAQRLYKSTLGAEVEATIRNLYSADEVLMIARNINL